MSRHMRSTTDEYRGPLDGITVLDVGHYYAGPMVGMLLADQGANVIRIVRPGAPELPSQQYRLLNRNKKLLELDLKTETGRQHALSLMEHADVVIENFRPGVMKRLGLDYTRLKERNPGLIYLSLPGFASTDRERAHLQAWEGVMNAASCGFTHIHWWREKAGFPPVYTGMPMCSAHGSMQGAIAMMAALTAREQHGQGTVIEVPLVAAALVGHMNDLIGPPRNTGDQVPKAIPEVFKPFAYSPEDSEETFLDKLDQLSRLPLIGVFCKWYRCSDDRELLLWLNNEAVLDRLLKTLGIHRQVLREGFVAAGPWVSGLENNLTGTLSPERSRRLVQLLSEAFMQKPAEEWETLLGESGIAVAMIRTRDEWMALEPAHRSGIFTQMDNGVSRLIVPGQFADVSGPGSTLIVNRFAEPERISIAQARTLFAGRVEETGRRNGLPLKKGDLLKGLKVLDLTNLVAGPTATNTLAQYGAEVIKADPPRFVHPALIAGSMLEVNQGKRSILTDLTTAPGRDVFSRLVRWADVVVHNSVDGVADRLGVTLTQLQAINPDVVVCQFSAHGGLYRDRGGWEKRPGFDNSAQAVSGIMVQYGSLDSPQFHGQITCGDIMGGIGGAFAALLGIYQQRRTGHAGEARSSLDRMINYIQLPGMISENGSSDWDEPTGQLVSGEYWWKRLYRCRDRWIYMEVPRARAEALTVTALNRSPSGDPAVDERELEKAFETQDYRHWLAKLDEAGIPCHLAVNANDICAQGTQSVGNEAADAYAKGTVELVVREDHPAGKPIVNLAPTWVRIGEDHNYKRLTPALRYGQHTREILAELGYSEAEIDTLIQLRISHEYFPAVGGMDYFFDPAKH